MSDGDDDLDPTRRYHRGDPQSEEAYASLSAETKEILRQRIWALIDSRAGRGATCDEIEAVTGLSHQTASPRFTEMHYTYLSIRRTGEKRVTRNDRNAWVYVTIIPGSPPCGCGRHQAARSPVPAAAREGT